MGKESTKRCAMPCLCFGEHVVTLTDRRREQMGMMKHDTGYASIHVVTFGWYTSYEVIMQDAKRDYIHGKHETTSDLTQSPIMIDHLLIILSLSLRNFSFLSLLSLSSFSANISSFLAILIARRSSSSTSLKPASISDPSESES